MDESPGPKSCNFFFFVIFILYIILKKLLGTNRNLKKGKRFLRHIDTLGAENLLKKTSS